MTNKNWRGIAEFVGITAIVGSLIFVGVQLRQDRVIALAQTSQTIIESRNDWYLAIGDSADLWLKADNGDELSPAENLKLEKQVAALSSSTYLEYNMRRSLGNVGNTPRRRLATILFQHPGARKAWLSISERDSRYFEMMSAEEPDEHWARQWRNMVMAELAILDELTQ